MNKTNIIIEKLKNIQKELEDVKDIDNNNIIYEMNILINHINDTIDNIENSINDKNNYNRNKIKNNIIFKIFMPYIIYLSFIIKDTDILAAETSFKLSLDANTCANTCSDICPKTTEIPPGVGDILADQELEGNGIDDLEQLSTFNESFFKEVLKKYIKQ